MKYILTIFFLMNFGALYAQYPEDLVQAQLDAYNERDIEAFLEPYSATVKVFDSKGRLLYQGKEKIRLQYGAFLEKLTDLHCTLVNRIILENTVIDHEDVTFDLTRRMEAIVMYKIDNSKIQEVHFLKQTEF